MCKEGAGFGERANPGRRERRPGSDSLGSLRWKNDPFKAEMCRSRVSGSDDFAGEGPEGRVAPGWA